MSQLDLRNVRLTSLNGAVLIDRNLEVNARYHELSLGRVPTGIYLLQVTDAAGLQHNHKVYLK